uniref:SURP motif domain-containing protein n=1 Tax=Anopheles atroparvus TaxID=41427 RepID=A0AAG5CU39_ANOAO
MLGNQVPFNYDAAQTQDGAIVATVEERTANSADEQDDDPYEPPKNFEIPPDIALPESMKEHAIIEKTAKFIASQDAQMEILLKTKQANNPQFEFLTQGSRLFRYYRHVLLAFRTNQYPTEVDQPLDDENGKVSDTEADGDANPGAQVRPKIVVPAIKYKPSVDCAYTQLISKITGAPIPTFVADAADSQAEVPTNAQQLTSLNTEFDYYPESSTSSASVEVKKVSTGLAGLVQYDSESGGSDDESQENNGKGKADGGKQEKDIGPFQGVLPPVTVQHVIDRTAIYVAKNGYSFEEALRVKNDPRFVFLNRAHEYYPYYAYLVRQRMMGGGEEIVRLQQPAPPSPSKVTIRTETENGTVVETTPSLGIKAVHTAVPKVVPAPVTNIQHQKLGAPVSFSLVVRKAKEDGGATMKAMPGLGGSEDEEEADGGNQQTEDCVNKQAQPDEGTECPTMEVTVATDAEVKEIPATETNITTEDIAGKLLEETVEALEISSLPVVSDEPPVPELTISKEKQAERKKRANMFVNLIKQQPKVAGEEIVEEKKTITDEKVAKADSVNNSDAEEGSIQSVHSTSPSPKKDTTVPLVSAASTCTSTTVIDDDDDDDVVLVSETRPAPARSRSRSRHTRSKSKHETGERRAKKKKSKSRHRSARVKKKSKKKSGSRSRSVSRTRSDRSASRGARSRKRHSRSRRGEDRTSRSTSRSTADSASSRRSKRRSVSRHSSRSSRIKRTAKRPKHTSRSRSRTPEASRSSKRAPSADRKRRKETRRSREPSQGKKRKHRSRSRSSQRKHDSDTENRHRRKHRRGAGDGHDGYDERYPPTRGRYWDC